MPQLQSVVLTDRETSPANHTFVPRDIVGAVGTVVESTGVPIGNSSLSVSLRKTPSGKYRAVINLAVPVVQTETVNGVGRPVVVRVAFASCEFTFAEQSTEQERKNLIGMFMSALDPSKVLVNDTLVKLQGVY